jgi:hypothetical protein
MLDRCSRSKPERFYFPPELILPATGAESQEFLPDLSNLLFHIFHGVLWAEIRATASAVYGLLSNSRFEDHPARGLNKVAEAYILRTNVCTQIACQAEPELVIL